MKVSELFEANYKNMSVNSIIDSEIQRQHNASKKGMDPDARNKRSSARGFRVGFATDSWDGAEGLNDADMKFFHAGEAAGKKAKKAHKGEIPPIQLKNSYGERRPNPAFNKVIKPYLDAFHATPVNEAKTKEETAEATFLRYNSLKKSHADPALLAKVLALATSKMNERFNTRKRNLDAQFGGEGWWEDCKKMYKIEEQGNKWVITSNARDWKQTKEWELDTHYEAIEKLDKLIMYKANDRKKGVGSVDKDYERIEKLTKS
jgi:hypothetical protein